MEEEQYGQAPP